MITRGDTVVAGVSGGADSVLMLIALDRLRWELGFSLFAAHVNHGLRGEDSDADEAFTRKFCIKRKVFVFRRSVDVMAYAKENRQSVEESARDLRYAVFAEALAYYGANKVATAHTLNDQAETIVMRLMRGAGALGLSGIPACSGNVIRPLINEARGDIEAALATLGQDWRHDVSNDDIRFTRNRVRHELMPALRGFSLSVEGRLADSARLLSDDDDYLGMLAKKLFEKIRKSKGSYLVEPLIDEHQAIKSRAVRMCLADAIGSPIDLSYAHIRDVCKILSSPSGREICLPNGYRVRTSFGRLEIYAEREAKSYSYTMCVPGSVFIEEIGAMVSASREPPGMAASLGGLQEIFVRSRLPGDFINIRHIGTQKLKKFFISNKIGKARRDSLPLAALGSEIVWIAGMRIGSRFEPDAQSEDVIYLSVKEKGEEGNA